MRKWGLPDTWCSEGQQPVCSQTDLDVVAHPMTSHPHDRWTNWFFAALTFAADSKLRSGKQLKNSPSSARGEITWNNKIQRTTNLKVSGMQSSFHINFTWVTYGLCNAVLLLIASIHCLRSHCSQCGPRGGRKIYCTILYIPIQSHSSLVNNRTQIVQICIDL